MYLPNQAMKRFIVISVTNLVIDIISLKMLILYINSHILTKDNKQEMGVAK